MRDSDNIPGGTDLGGTERRGVIQMWDYARELDRKGNPALLRKMEASRASIRHYRRR